MTESECKQGIEAIRKFTEETRAIIEKNNITIAEYNALHKIYERDLLIYNTVTVPAWELIKNNEYQRLANERRIWYNFTPALDNVTVRKSYCEKDFGILGFNDYAGVFEYDWARAFIKGMCKRDAATLTRDIESWVAANPKPQGPVAPVMGKLFEHGAIPNSIINCCTNVANIIGSEITDSNISQFADCVANIQGLPDTSTGSSGAAGAAGTAGTAGTTTAPSKETTTPTVNVISEKKPDPENTETSNLPLYAAIGLGGLALVSLAFV